VEIASFDGELERTVLSSLIHSDAVLAASAVSYRQSPFLFRSDAANSVARWCVHYYKRYGKAPGSDITQFPVEIALTDESQARRIALLIESLPPLQSSNNDRLIDIASKHYEQVQIEYLIESLKAKMSRDDTNGCYELINGFSRISRGVTTGVNPFTDEEAIRAAYAENTDKSLLTFKEADSAAFFGDTFCRSSFVVVNAAEKSGKSSLLREIALRALRQGYNVAYFDAGDNSQGQLLRLLYQRITRHPKRAGTVRIPTTLSVREIDGESSVDIQHEEREYAEDMNVDIALAECRKWAVDLAETSKAWKLSVHSHDLTVSEIKVILDEWERTENFIPDFIFVDYADLLIPESKEVEFRHRINATYKQLRGLSLARNVCLVSATQAKADALESKVMTRKHLAEDKRKAADPTAILGLCATEYEWDLGVARLNFLVRRGEPCNPYDQLYVARCFEIANPMMRVYYPPIHRHEDRGPTSTRTMGFATGGAPQAKVEKTPDVQDWSPAPVESPPRGGVLKEDTSGYERETYESQYRRKKNKYR